MNRRLRIQRRSLACARCRRRKIPCDAAIPSCSSCSEANAACFAWNPAENSTAPRSIAKYLEDQIAALERHVPSASVSDDSLTSVYATGTAIQDGETWPLDRSRRVAHNSASSNVLYDSTPTFLGLTRTNPLAGCVTESTHLPSAQTSFGLSDLKQNHPRAILNQPSPTLLPTSVPIRVAEYLLGIYTNRIIHQYPIYHVTEVKQAFTDVLNNPSSTSIGEPERKIRNIYIVSIMMAISLSTAARNKQANAYSLATRLFRNAMLHVSTVLTNDIPGLQALLLLIHYAYLNPSVGNLWLLTGLSSEACLDMGLHQELPSSAGIDVLGRDLRRRVFWCAWEMEVAVSACFRRPTRLANNIVNVAFSSEFEDDSITRQAIHESGRKAKFATHRIWSFRQIETDTMAVLYQNAPLPPNTSSLDEWVLSMEQKVYEWLQEVQKSASDNKDPSIKSQWEEMVLYADVAYHLEITLLYAPSPRRKHLNRQNCSRVFESGVRVATAYTEYLNTEFGYVKYVFHACYHTFSAAVAFLQVLQTCKLDIAELYALQEIEDRASSFSKLFSTVSERWPASLRCLQEYNRLLGPIMKEYSEFLLSHTEAWNLPASLESTEPSTDPSASVDVAEPFNIVSLFNPFIDATAIGLLDPYMSMPYDWNAEFEFGMEMTESASPAG